MLEKANVPITIMHGESAQAAYGHVERACMVARQAVGPTACLTAVYQSTGEGCIHLTAVFAACADAPAAGEVEGQLWERIDLTPLALPEPSPPPRGALTLSAGEGRADGRGEWMQTATGRAFYPLDPRPEEIDLYEIASGLSRMCRYGGQIGRLEFYSVAEHSVLLSYVVPPELARWALLHDSSEAYIVDVPRPIKPALVGYAQIEDRLMRAVAVRFGLEWPMPDALKAYDDRILQNERRALWDVPPPRPWVSDAAGAPLPGITVTGWLPFQARNRFLARAAELGVKAVGHA